MLTKNEHESETMSLIEAAKFLGFTSTNRLRQKAKTGKIPACKPGRNWRFIKADLVQWMREQYDTHRKVAQVDMKGGSLCQSVKRKEVLTTIHASRSVELELNNLLGVPQRERLKSMRKSLEEK